MSVYSGASVLYDDFNASSLNTTHFTNITGADVAQTGNGNLSIEDQTAYPGIVQKSSFNVSGGIIAVKWAGGSGTATPTTSFRIGLVDGSSKEIGVEMFIGATGASGKRGNGSKFYTVGSGVTVGDSTTFPTGLGTDLQVNEWVGIGRLTGTNLFGIYKSLDGARWFLQRRTTWGGIDRTACKMKVTAGHTDSGVSKSWYASITEMRTVSLTPRFKVRVGGAWVEGCLKSRSGGSWVQTSPQWRGASGWAH